MPTVANLGTGNATTAGVPTSMSFGYTSSGPNALLVVRLSMSSGASASTVTYNGVALKFLRRDVAASVGWAMETWYLVAPPAGSFPIVVTTGFSTQVLVGATTYNGVTTPAQSHRSQWLQLGEQRDELVVEPDHARGRYQ